MRFFMYNGEIINLAQVTNFTCYQDDTTPADKETPFILKAHLNHSHGFWEKEGMTMGVNIYLGDFESRDAGFKIVKDILAGIYDLQCIQPVTVNVASQITPPETPKAQEKTTAKEESNSTTVEQPQNQEEKERIMEAARELFKHPQTAIVAQKIGIDKIHIYTEAECIWGSSDKWTTETWEEYVKAIAGFHQEKGLLYDKFKPQTQQTKSKKDGDGPF